MSRHINRSLNRPAQQGITLVELLVALVISLVIVIAAVASLTVARRGFSTVDAASQLRDNGRFVADLVQRIGVQTGYLDPRFATAKCTANDPTCPLIADKFALISPAVLGVQNAKPSPTDPTNSSIPHPSGEVGAGSDVLVMRYQMSRMYPDDLDSNKVDGTMIDCQGTTSAASPTPPMDRNERLYSVLYVGPGISGEPALLCYRQTASGPMSQPLIEGVENFQVLYGVNGVTPGTAPALWPNDDIPTVPERYLRADQMAVGTNTVDTAANWRRVRSIRVGMVLRGPPNSAQDRSAQTLYPFGTAKGSATGAVGSAFVSVSDAGTAFSAPADGRLRQVVTFTVHLRNFQEQ